MDVQSRKRMANALASLKAEATVLERFLYKFANSFSKEKLYRSLKQTAKRVSFVLEKIGDKKDLAREDAESKAFLQNLLEDIKLRSAVAGHHAQTRVGTGHHWQQWALVVGICSRLWCLAEFFLKSFSGFSEKRPEVPAVIPAERFMTAPRKNKEQKVAVEPQQKDTSVESVQKPELGSLLPSANQRKKNKGSVKPSVALVEPVSPRVGLKKRKHEEEVRNLPSSSMPSKKRKLKIESSRKIRPKMKKSKVEEIKSKKNPSVKAVCGSWTIV